MAHEVDGPSKGELEMSNGQPNYKQAIRCPDCGYQRKTTEQNPTLAECPKCGTMMEYAD